MYIVYQSPRGNSVANLVNKSRTLDKSSYLRGWKEFFLSLTVFFFIMAHHFYLCHLI